MRKEVVLLVVLVLLAGCKSDSAETPQTKTAPVAEESSPESIDSEKLVPVASSVINSIAELEKKKDVTCWTSFRQLDQFIATKSYSEFATLAKIRSQKAFVFSVWQAASKRPGDTVTAEDIDAVITLRNVTVPDERRAELKSFATDLGMKDFDDYRKTGEHYRVVLASTFDAIAHNPGNLKPLDKSAQDRLADVVMQLSLELLKESGAVATKERSPFIEGSHVKAAHADLMKSYKLADPIPLPQIENPARAATLIAPLTDKLISAKIAALKHFNKEDPRSPLQTEDTLRAINEVSPMPVTEDGLQSLVLQLRSVARFITSGLEPMRSDNYLSDGQFAPKPIERQLYVDEAWTENAIMQIWPHVVMPNGDIKLRLEPNPGTIAKEPREPRDILLLDYNQNAVRDSAIHWEILAREFDERAFAMEPFAAEFFSEVLSMMLTHYLFEGERIAKAAGKDKIDASVARQLRNPLYVQVMPKTSEFEGWGDDEKAKKEAAMKAFGGPHFADVSSKSGLPTKLDLNSVRPEIVKSGDIQRPMGAGIAVGDMDADGFPDLFLSGEGLGRLYRNKGAGAPGTFEDVTVTSGLPEGMDDSRGALMLDFDGDGDDDLLVLRSSEPSHLFMNESGKFVDKAQSLGFKTTRGAHVATVFDFDGDGDLDIYVGYYGAHDVNSGKNPGRSLPAIDGRNGTPNQLWRNDGSKFTEVGESTGVADVGWTLAASTFDYDKDGDLDLYIANDFGGNGFFRNDGGKFVEISRQNHTHDRGSGMNVSFSDVNNDGWLDLFLTNIDMFSKSIKVIFPTQKTTVDIDEQLQKSFQYIAGNKLYENVADGEARSFESVDLQRFEPGDQGWAWDGNFADVDHDGDEDLYVSNGWIEGSYAADQNNILFVRDGEHFFRAPAEWDVSFAGNSRAVAAVDIDRDGDLDFVVNNFQQPPRVLENSTNDKRSIGVQLVGKGKLKHPTGARIEVKAGGATHVRQVTGGRGYLSQADKFLHVGIGDAKSAAVTVIWPDGSKSTETVEAGARTTITQK